MKQVNLPSYDSSKRFIIDKYPALAGGIRQLEEKILENPAEGIKETLIVNNRPVVTRKRGIRTNLFSDRLPDHYLYLTTNYGLTNDDTLVFLGLYLHDYIV
jgi:hypothetical protein